MAPAVAKTDDARRPEALSFTTRLVLVCAGCIALPLAAAFVTGSIGIPHNDDWAFLRILFHLADTGSLELVGWNEMTLVGHLALALPVVRLFGNDVAALNVFVAFVSGAGLYMLGMVARRFVDPPYALLIVVLVGVFPGFALVTATFMTDNTAFAAQMGCVLVGLIALDRHGARRDLLLAAALAIGLFAFSIREFALLAPIAVVAGYGVANRRDGRSILRAAAALAALLAAAYFLYEWRRRLPGDTSHFFRNNFSLNMVPFLAQMFFTFSLGLAPAVVLSVRNRVRNPVAWAPFAIPAAALALFTIVQTDNRPTCCLRGEGSVFVGNLLTQRGALGNQALFGDRPSLFPEPLWLLMTGAAVAAGACLLALGWKGLVRFRRRSAAVDPAAATLAVLGIATTGAIFFRHALGGPLFDRYATVLVAIGAIFLLRNVRTPRRWRLRSAVATMVALALIAVISVGSAASFDAARWRAGEAAVAAGIPAGDVDAGFEWVGFHYDGVANQRIVRRSAPTPPGYMNLFGEAGNCGLVAASAQNHPDLELLQPIPYSDRAGTRVQMLWVYRYEAGCRAARAYVTRGT